MPVYINPIYRMCEFIIGMYVAKLFLKTPNWGNVCYIGISAMAVVLLVVLVPILYENNYLNQGNFRNNYIYYNCLTVPLCSMIIFCCASIRGRVCDWLNRSRVLFFLAGLTFPFYLYQGLSQRLAKTVYTYLHPYASALTLLESLIMTNFVFAVVSYIMLDKLLSRYLNKKIKKEFPR